MRWVLTSMAVTWLVLPYPGIAQADTVKTGGRVGCFFEADFLEKRIKGDTREAREAEARRWYIRRLVINALEDREKEARRVGHMSPLPDNFRGS